MTPMGRRVAERARLLAETGDAGIHLLHVLEPLGEAMIDPSIARMVRDHQRREAERLAEWVRERASVEVTLEVVKGSPSWELAARAKTAAVTVVGSSSVDAFSVGPVARRVALMSTSDTLVVRRQPRVPYRRIIAAVDFSEHSRKAVSRSAELFPEAEITVLYSLPSRFDPVLGEAGMFKEEVQAARIGRLRQAEERLEEFVQPWDGRVRSMVADGPPSQTIEEVVRRRSADLVVVGSRGASATRMVLLGSVAEALIAEAPCDVLVARAGSAFRRP